MEAFSRFVRSFSAASVPPPHPAAYAKTHLYPGVVAFLTKGDGLPSLAQLTSATAFKQWYSTTEPLQSAMAICAFFTTISWLGCEVTGNSSQVDRLWAVLPIFYSAHFVFHDYFAPTQSITKKILATRTNAVFSFLPDSVDERMALILFLQILWSLRLNGNTLRRDFFDFSTEDYRWPWLRKRLAWWQYKIFNLTFIAFTQNVLLASPGLFHYLLRTAHTDVHPTWPYPGLGPIDWALAGLFVANLVTEQIADSQQQSYQNWKHAELKRRARGKGAQGDADSTVSAIDSTRNEAAIQRGFCTDGLWAWSRHPNFACEQLNFYILYAMTLPATIPPSVGKAIYEGFRNAVNRQSTKGLLTILERAAPHLYNYTFWMPVAMSMIFVGSAPLTEYISSGKYPLYKQYQRRVAMFAPFETLFVKLPYLSLTGQRSKVNKDVFGDGSLRYIEAGKKKQ